MITIAVCDDNIQFASLLSQRIQQLCAYKVPQRLDCKVISPFVSAKEVIDYLQVNSIDVLFLDIDMPNTNGFELAKMLCEVYPDTVIIFVSAYEEFVYSSFEYCPFRFLRKAHLSNELETTFEKVIEKCVINNEVLLFDTTDGETLLKVKDILFFESQKNYFFIYTSSGKIYKARGTIKNVEQMTKSFDFFKIHASYVVNMDHIDNINNKGYLIMKNGKILSISKKRSSVFKDAYMEFIRRRVSK